MQSSHEYNIFMKQVVLKHKFTDFIDTLVQDVYQHVTYNFI